MPCRGARARAHTHTLSHSTEARARAGPRPGIPRAQPRALPDPQSPAQSTAGEGRGKSDYASRISSTKRDYASRTTKTDYASRVSSTRGERSPSVQGFEVNAHPALGGILAWSVGYAQQKTGGARAGRVDALPLPVLRLRRRRPSVKRLSFRSQVDEFVPPILVSPDGFVL